MGFSRRLTCFLGLVVAVFTDDFQMVFGLKPDSEIKTDTGCLLMMLSLETLSLSQRKVTKRREVDPYFSLATVENFLPQTYYDELSAKFPPKEACKVFDSYQNKHALGTKATPLEFWDYVEKNPVWKPLIHAFQSPELLQDWQGFWGGTHKAWVAYSEERNPLRQFLNAVSGGWKKQPVDIQFEFSMLQAGDFLLPHSDSTRKILSILLNFPDKRWKPEYGGDTLFFKPKTHDYASRWSKVINKIPEDRVEEFKSENEVAFRAPFIPNILVAFAKSDLSFHEVEPIRCPPGMTRNSFIINVSKAK